MHQFNFSVAGSSDLNSNIDNSHITSVSLHSGNLHMNLEVPFPNEMFEFIKTWLFPEHTPIQKVRNDMLLKFAEEHIYKFC